MTFDHLHPPLLQHRRPFHPFSDDCDVDGAAYVFASPLFLGLAQAMAPSVANMDERVP